MTQKIADNRGFSDAAQRRANRRQRRFRERRLEATQTMTVQRTEVLGGGEFFRRQAGHGTEIAPAVAFADISEMLQQ